MPIKSIPFIRILRQSPQDVSCRRSETTSGRSANLALLPGYVFLFSPEDTAESQLHERVTDMYKFLEYEDGIRDLCNEDYDYAMWIYNNHGSIAPSRILADGTVIRVIDGPLLDCHGKIVRLDKHKRRVLVEFDFDGSKRVISLSADVCDEYCETRSIIRSPCQYYGYQVRNGK